MCGPIFDNLTGKILIASPYVQFSSLFRRSIIYVLSHSTAGSIGLMVNNLVNKMPVKSLFKEVQPKVETDPLLSVYMGGPVEVERGFFLHSADYTKNLLFKFGEDIAISSNSQIAEDIALGSGPRDSLFIIGYTGWEAGQMEKEIELNYWIVSDVQKDLIFQEDNDVKWKAALTRVGIEDHSFASQLGHS